MGADTLLPSAGEPGSVGRRRRRGDGEQLPMLEGARGEKGLGVSVGGTSGLGRCEVGEARRAVRCGAVRRTSGSAVELAWEAEEVVV